MCGSSKIPEYANHRDPTLRGEFARLFVHAEHSKGMLPSTREQLLLHGNLLLSGIINIKEDYFSKSKSKFSEKF